MTGAIQPVSTPPMRPAVSLRGEPVRTMWDAAREMFAEAHRRRDEAMWDRAYRLWCQACFCNAPGQAYALTSYRPLWLPTTLPPEAKGCTCTGNGELDAGNTSHQDRRGWTP